MEHFNYLRGERDFPLIKAEHSNFSRNGYISEVFMVGKNEHELKKKPACLALSRMRGAAVRPCLVCFNNVINKASIKVCRLLLGAWRAAELPHPNPHLNPHPKVSVHTEGRHSGSVLEDEALRSRGEQPRSTLSFPCF